MANLNVDWTAVSTLSKNIASSAEEFNGYLSKVKADNENLKTFWQGADADQYTGKITEQAKVMDDLYQTLVNVCKYLDQVGAAYQETMQANRDAINR